MKISNNKRNTQGLFLRIVNLIGIISVVIMFAFMEKLEISPADFCIYTGIVLLLVTSSSIGKNKKKELAKLTKHTEKLKEEIGTESYVNGSMFFE